MGHKRVVKGILREVNTCSDFGADEIEIDDSGGCCQRRHEFYLDNGEFFMEVTNECDAPINEPLVVSIKDGVLISYHIRDDVPERMISDSVKDIALVRIVSTEEDITQRRIDSTTAHAQTIQAAIHRIGQGKWNVKCTPYVIHNEAGQFLFLNSFSFNHPSVQEQMEAINPDGWNQHNYFSGWGGWKNAILGEALVNSYRSWTYSGGIRTVLHEICHSLGCGHATSSGGEYGDMSSRVARGSRGMNGHHMQVLQLGNDKNTLEGNLSNQWVKLVPLETPDTDLMDDEYKYVNLLSGNWCTLSARKLASQHKEGYSRANFSNPGLYLHESEPRNRKHGNRSNVIAYMEEGVSRSTGEHTITLDSVVDGVLLVKIDKGGDSSTFPSKPEVKIEFPKDSDSFSDEHSTLWTASNYYNQGMDIWKIGDKMVGYWYSHTADGFREAQGNPAYGVPERKGLVWLYLDGEINSEGSIDIDIMYVDEDDNMQSDGKGVLRFIGNEEAIFQFDTKQYGRDHLELSRLMPPRHEHESRLTNLWESGDSEGFVITDYKDIILGYYYHRNGDELHWYYLDSTDNPNSSTIEFNVYQSKSEYKDLFKRDAEKIGNATWNVDDEKISIFGKELSLNPVIKE